MCSWISFWCCCHNVCFIVKNIKLLFVPVAVTAALDFPPYIRIDDTFCWNVSFRFTFYSVTTLFGLVFFLILRYKYLTEWHFSSYSHRSHIIRCAFFLIFPHWLTLTHRQERQRHIFLFFSVLKIKQILATTLTSAASCNIWTVLLS